MVNNVQYLVNLFLLLFFILFEDDKNQLGSVFEIELNVEIVFYLYEFFEMDDECGLLLVWLVCCGEELDNELYCCLISFGFSVIQFSVLILFLIF